MPTLDGQAKEKYIKAYGAETYNQWCDIDGKHGGKAPVGDINNVEMPSFTHKPCHDVESTYWTLLYSLVKAHPASDFSLAI